MEVSEKRRLTVSDVCKLYSVSRTWVHNMRQHGMPHYRIGGKILFVPDEVESFFNSHKVS